MMDYRKKQSLVYWRVVIFPGGPRGTGNPGDPRERKERGMKTGRAILKNASSCQSFPTIPVKNFLMDIS
jgi:hypothetical protein